jgi:molybdopterin converting factor subunit 1
MAPAPDTVTVLYFAVARERAGTSREVISPPPPTVAALLEELCVRHEGLRSLIPHLRVAVNQEIAQSSDALPGGAEVALIPPVSGGSGCFRISDAPLSLDEVVKAVSGQAFGGLATFSGSVRDQTRGRRVVRLEYEAYRPMAEKALAAIGLEVARTWPGTRLAIVHRVGALLPGELAVVIAAAAPHRKEAFLSCEHALERLKQDAPIWKKEVYEDGEVWVGLHP